MPASPSGCEHMTTNFYVPPDQFHGDRVRLVEEEARHASKVLRAKIGDEITVVDGACGWYRVEIDQVDRHSLSGHVVERRSGVGEPPYELVLGIGLIKHRSRFETLLEKAVELGVATIAPLVTERTERERIREERSEGILIAAMKQCGRSRLPKLLEPLHFDNFLELASSEWSADLRVICHEGARQDVLGLLRTKDAVRTVVATIGPEGGFSDDELRRARAAGFETVSLGSRRLRAESAGIAAAAAVMLALDTRTKGGLTPLKSS